MRANRWLLVVAAVIVAFGALSLGLAQNWGWATPFRLPGVISYHGRSYSIDTNTWNGSRACFAADRVAAGPIHIYRLPRGYTPTRQVGHVFGYFTHAKPILLPHYEWTYRKVYVVLVRDGSCLRYYSVPGSP
jgi:hypothetical protein